MKNDAVTIRNWISKRVNKRRLIYAAGFLIIVGLAGSLVLTINQSNARAERLYQRQIQLESTLERLEQVQAQKAESDAEIQQKAAKEAEMKAEIEKLKKDLQAKKAEELRLARLAKERTGGIGGTFTATRPVGSTAGNTYTYGYCTWYVKNRRPSIPNGWGNAYEWLGNARSQGFATGSTPRAGAVGTAGNHVVYIERVNSDGTVYISEMNYEGWNIKSYRTTPGSYWTYIY